MESATGEVEAEGAMNGQTDLTSTGQTDRWCSRTKTGGKKQRTFITETRMPT